MTLSCAQPGPDASASAVAPASAVTIDLLIISSISLSMPRVAEGPNEKIVAHVVVDLCKSERLVEQKADNQRAVEHEWNVRNDLRIHRQVERDCERVDEVVQEDRCEEDEARAEEAAEHAAQAADDHHCDGLDRDFEVELLGRDSAIVAEGQHGTRHTADE